MNSPRVWRLFCSLAACSFLSAPTVHAQDAADQIRKKLAEFQKVADSSADTSKEWQQLKPALLAPLKRGQFSLQAGHLYGALDEVGQAWIYVSSHDEILRHPEIATEGMKAFDKEWARVDAVLKRQERTYSSYSWADRPAAVRALSQAWFGKTRRMFDGGRGFAISTKPEDGVFYLGSAQATSAMAVFCGTVRLTEKGKPRTMRSYLPEIEALDQQVQAAYAPPASIDHHADFIRLSALMKDARELDASQSYDGSLLQYLEATRLYSMIATPATDSLNED